MFRSQYFKFKPICTAVEGLTQIFCKVEFWFINRQFSKCLHSFINRSYNVSDVGRLWLSKKKKKISKKCITQYWWVATIGGRCRLCRRLNALYYTYVPYYNVYNIILYPHDDGECWWLFVLYSNKLYKLVKSQWPPRCRRIRM